MCAMMGATLKAPLAALMTLLELTSNPHIILPGMLAIVFSSIVVFELFKLDSAFLVLLRK
jgi:CIC family chloride channel protein